MSFVDLSTLALHRRNELEARTRGFLDKCDQAINDINKIKNVAQSFVQRLNCEPAELKQNFLNCMKELDEFTYLITDFNICINKLELGNSAETSPDHESPNKSLVQTSPFNLMDALCESLPSTSTSCAIQSPMNNSNKNKISTNEQELIKFSSNCISDSASQEINKPLNVLQHFVGNTRLGISMIAAQSNNLPAQTLLEPEQEYPAIILNVDGLSFWVITETPNYVSDFIIEMSDFYARCTTILTTEEISKLTYCASYDDESDCYYRGLFIRLSQEDNKKVEVFLMDIGEVQIKDIENIKPLINRFCKDAPFARCCHLAGIEPVTQKEQELEASLKKYVGTPCTIQVEDNTSESLAVYVTVKSFSENLNRMLVNQGLAKPIEIINPEDGAGNNNNSGLPELTESQLYINDCPEHDDPVEAVMGYHNRDEADICKHYKGGPERSCFKGARCTKKHIVKHPDGWTLDRISVMGKCPARALPPPSSRLRVHVTHVAHYDRIFVQLVNEEANASELSTFGVTLPPNNLDALVRDMNCPATRLAYKQLKMTPAPGELVAALYPLDGQWYRARVLSSTRLDQSVEVMYIDYGNVVWVKEENVRELEPRHCVLEVQAICCSLAGVRTRISCSRQWALARALLQRLTTERTLWAYVVACDYDEITVELYDENNTNVLEQFAASKLVELVDYTQDVGNEARQRIIAP